jgi:ferrous iron transport protein B
LEFIDLPGTYSLSAYSFEEVVSRDFIIFQKPDVVLDVLDATNLERNLYLCLQFQELGVPLVGALNMIDEAEKNGILIDVEHLSDLLQIPFVKTSAYYKRGMEELMEVLLKTALDQREILKLAAQNDLPFGNSEPVGRHLNYGRDIEKYHNDLIQFLSSDASFAKRYSLHWMAIKLIENDSDALKKIKEEHMEADIIIAKCELIRQSIFIEFSMEATSLVAQQRYGFIRGAIREAVNFTPLTEDSLTEKLDRFALHKHLGMVIFFAMMYLIYYLTFTIGNYLSDYVALLFKFISEIVSLLIPQGIFQRFLVEGIIGGVGGVIVFLPIILLIFAGLSFLEDSGYLARASFVMDRFMHQFKMHGRSFIPLMISTGCAVPAVMSTRALASQKDRIITAMVLPMMMCTAKTPVVAMLVGVFFINHAGVVFWLIWFFAWLVALFSALFLNKTVFQGDATPFVMELPPYRFPTLFGIMKHMWDKAMGYLKKAGTIILAASIITWIVFNFPKKENLSFDYISQKEQITQQIKELKVKGNEPDKFKIDLLNHKRIELENRRSKEEIGYSIGGRIGMFIEPFFALMGFDWKMSVSILAALPAKEIVVSTMGVVYGIGELAKETDKGEGGSLKEAIRHDPNYNPLTIISFLIFVMLYSPCFATLAVIKRELGGWRWVFFSMIFSFSLASILAIMVYQLGKILI